jgi:hypothetical protein
MSTDTARIVGIDTVSFDTPHGRINVTDRDGMTVVAGPGGRHLTPGEEAAYKERARAVLAGGDDDFNRAHTHT